MNNVPDEFNNPPVKKPTVNEPEIQLVGSSQSQTQQRRPVRAVILDSETKPPWSRRILDNLGSLAIIGIILLGILYVTLNIGAYFDPLSMCRIRIHADLVAGNKKSISQGLCLLKKEDRAGYKLACQYVDRIYERTCIGSDWHLDKDQDGSNEAGCYVKGSKVIYIKPVYSKTTVAVDYKDAIKKYSRLSQEYWSANR